MPFSKKKQGGAATGATPAPSLNNDVEMSHTEMNKAFEESASKLSLDDEITIDLPKSNYEVSTVDVDMINKNRSMLNDKQWGAHYRGRLKGMDELVSTASVRQIAKGLFKTKNPTGKQLLTISKFVNTISAVRLPTEGSGFSFKDGSKTMQHPTSKASAMWGSTGKNHNGFDRARRQAVLKTFQAHVEKGSDMQTTMKAMISRAITFTLNVFTAPVTAKNLKTLNKLNDDAAMKQVEDRDREKERAKSLGAKQRSGTGNDIDRDWEGDDRSDISEDRFLGDEREKEVRVKQTNVATITNKPKGKGKKKNVATITNKAKGKGKKAAASPFNGAKKITKGPSKAAKKIGKTSAVKKQQKKTINTGTRKSARLAMKQK